MNTLFPVFIKVDLINTLIVGGGNVALEKLSAILANNSDAKIQLVAPQIKTEIAALSSDYPNLSLITRKFEYDDLEGRQLVICATDDKSLHKDIYQKCIEKKILVNVADTPDLCQFYLSSIVQKGDLKIAISTNGKSPTFAKRLKEVLNHTLNEYDIAQLLNNLEKYRNSLKGDFSEKIKKMNELTRTLI